MSKIFLHLNNIHNYKEEKAEGKEHRQLDKKTNRME